MGLSCVPFNLLFFLLVCQKRSLRIGKIYLVTISFTSEKIESLDQHKVFFVSHAHFSAPLHIFHKRVAHFIKQLVVLLGSAVSRLMSFELGDSGKFDPTIRTRDHLVRKEHVRKVLL